MKVTFTYQVAFWNGACNVLSAKIFQTLTEAQAYLGDPRYGCIYKNRILEEV